MCLSLTHIDNDDGVLCMFGVDVIYQMDSSIF